MKWQIIFDRFGEESRAKSEDGRVFTVSETAERIAEMYTVQGVKPTVEVYAVGLGVALAYELSALGVPIVTRTPCLKRIGGADIYVSP